MPFNSANIVLQRVMFLWTYRPIHRTNLFIVAGADLEYIKKNIYNFIVNDTVLGYTYI